MRAPVVRSLVVEGHGEEVWLAMDAIQHVVQGAAHLGSPGVEIVGFITAPARRGSRRFSWMVNKMMGRGHGGSGELTIAPGRLTAGVSPDEDGPPAEKGRAQERDGAGSMKPRDGQGSGRKGKQTDPEGCCRRACWFQRHLRGHLLLLAACNGGGRMKKARS